MAIIYWTNGVGGNFGTATNWSTNTVPGPFDQARINDGASVAASADETVLSLTTNAGASLGISPSQSFTMLEGTGIGANAGQIKIFDGAELFLHYPLQPRASNEAPTVVPAKASAPLALSALS